MFVLVGNKCDMTEDQVVKSHSGEEFAREHGLTFYEASAKENINVHEVIYGLTHASNYLLDLSRANVSLLFFFP